MADGFGSLGSAYSILGQATGDEYKRIREEEDKRRKKEEQAKYRSYFLAPLLQSAGQALTEGVTNLINTPQEEKYTEFLNSEKALSLRHAQKAKKAKADALQKRHKQALEHGAGAESFYADILYKQKLDAHERQFDKEEYKEGKNGVLYADARKEARAMMPTIEKAYEASFNVRTEEELGAALSKAYGSRSVLAALGRAVTSPFRNKNVEDVRQERLDFLQQQTKVRNSSIVQARKALGDTSLAAIVGLAKRTEDYRVTKDDWVTSSKGPLKQLPVTADDGTSTNIQVRVFTKQHPNKKNLTIDVVKGANPRAIEVLEKVKAGRGVIRSEKKETEIDSGFGFSYTQILNTAYNADGTITYKKENLDPKIMPPTQAAINATPGDLRDAASSFNQAIGNIKTIYTDGGVAETVQNSQIIETVASLGEGRTNVKDLKPRMDRIYGEIAGYTVSLQSRIPDLGKDVSSKLASVAKARYFGNLKSLEHEYVKEVGYIDDSPDWEDIDFDSSTGLNAVNFKNAGSVYALDAFFAAEGTASAISMKPENYKAIRDDAIDSFALLPSKTRLFFLNEFENEKMLREKDSLGMSYYNHLVVIHDEMSQ